MGGSKISRKCRNISIFGIILASCLCIVSAAEEYSVGSEDDDWWIVYPDQHLNTGSEVNHPSWILSALEDTPILILDHSQGRCKACIDQENDVNSVLEDLGGEITYHNLISGSGDQAADELFGIYDPNGGKSYIPLTIVVTLIQDDDGDVQVGWHSFETPTGEDRIRTYVEDAINYHEENVDNWEV